MSLTRTSGFRFLAIIDVLAAKNEVMLNGFRDAIALDDMTVGKTGYSCQIEEDPTAHMLASCLLGSYWGYIKSACPTLLNTGPNNLLVTRIIHTSPAKQHGSTDHADSNICRRMWNHELEAHWPLWRHVVKF